MVFHIVTLFPEFFTGPFAVGVVARAIRAGRLDIRLHNLRDWTFDRHRTVDDRPFGGGEGMLLKPEPIFLAVESIWPDRRAANASGARPAEDGKLVILLSAQGRLFHQALARQFSSAAELLLICGRYEGVDERVAEHLADYELSVGDYVLSGGEPAAVAVVDSVARLLPGVLGNQESTVWESFSEAGGMRGTLDYPQYTRPAEFRGWKIPDVLAGGNHEEIRRWRRRAALEKTARLRPDLLSRERNQSYESSIASQSDERE